MNINEIKNEPNWNQHLKTGESIQNYLSLRISELTDELKDQPISLEKTGVGQRMKWVAQIIYHFFGTVIFSIGKLFAKMGRSEKFKNSSNTKFFNHGTKLYARARQLESPKALLVKTHNGFNLKRSTLPLRTDLLYKDKPINFSEIEGNCTGTSYMFTFLYLEAKKKLPDLSDQDIILKIAHLMRNGALPEATIIQKLPGWDWIDVSTSLHPEAANKFAIAPEKRQLERIDILKSESKKKIQSACNKLKELKIGIPYHLTTRTSITGNTHATLVIRTGSEEFYWFDPSRGLTFFQGAAGMKKLARLWDYGTQQKCEKKLLKYDHKKLEECADDFAKRHQLTDSEKQLIKVVDQAIDQGKSWEEIEKLSGVSDQKKLVRHYFETHREKKRNLEQTQHRYGLPTGVVLKPIFDEMVGKNINPSQQVLCCHWKEPGPFDCPPLWD